MNKRFSIAALLCVSTSQLTGQVVQVASPVAGANVVDFNALALGAAGIGAFGGFGVTVTGGCFVANAMKAADFGNVMQASNVVQVDLFSGGTCAAPGQPAFGPLTLSFASTQNYFGLRFFSPSITLAGLSGSVSGTTNGLTGFVGFTEATGFNSVTITGGAAAGSFFIDDVSFSAAQVVPEPASMALVAAGLLGVAAVARRKRSA